MMSKENQESFLKVGINWYNTSNDKPLSNTLFIRDFFDKCFTFQGIF